MERPFQQEASADSSDFTRYIPKMDNVDDTPKCKCGNDCYMFPGFKKYESLCEDCLKKLQMKRLPEAFLAKANIPSIFWRSKVSFDNFEGGGINGIRTAIAIDPLPNIVLTGMTGSGKSRIACQIFHELITTGRAYRKNLWFLSAYRLIYEMLDTMSRDGGHKLDIIDRYAKYDVLIIDDLGFDDESKWATGQFYALIDMRINECRPTIITTNVKPADWARDLGARIESRLAGMEVFELPFGDYRKKR